MDAASDGATWRELCDVDIDGGSRSIIGVQESASSFELQFQFQF